jgi:2-amino-4-ketopentanoate thiolase beta subunit
VTASPSYESLLGRRTEILSHSVGLDYEQFRRSRLAWDHEALMGAVGYDIDEIARIQLDNGVGATPMREARSLTALVRRVAEPGCGARIFIKDEAANPSGSFKDRRASLSVYEAKQRGYAGAVAATSGNYGAAVASQAARAGLGCIVVQEAFDSRGVGQPEIIEKARACEEFGAEVIQCSVGPELFYLSLRLLEETGYFNASLYTPFSVAGIETLGVEVAEDIRRLADRDPDVVVVTHAGGGNVTGTARGLRKAGAAATTVIAATVDLRGLHMASDHDFNRKSFTTGHSGFAFPFTVRPDRSDVPFNAARPLRYIDRMVIVSQGEVFYATEALSKLEGMQRGPAGNTSLAAALAIARELPEDAIVVVQETEYTGAGKHPWAQLAFAVANGVEVRTGSARDNVPGAVIAVPDDPRQLTVEEVDLGQVRLSYLRQALEGVEPEDLTDVDLAFLADETRLQAHEVGELVAEGIEPAAQQSGAEVVET